MSDERLVYSTDGGRVRDCPLCGRSLRRCVCPESGPPPGPRGAAGRPAAPVGRSQPPRDGVVRVFRDRSGRHGKTVTLITGLPGDAERLTELAGSLKRLCGSGGAVKEGAVEIQGDHRERVAARLSELGYRVKLAGG